MQLLLLTLILPPLQIPHKAAAEPKYGSNVLVALRKTNGIT